MPLASGTLLLTAVTLTAAGTPQAPVQAEAGSATSSGAVPVDPHAAAIADAPSAASAGAAGAADAPRAGNAPVAAVSTSSPSGSGRSPAGEAADAAVRALGGVVARSSHPEALRTAFRAYFSYRQQRIDEVRRPYLYYIDLGLDNRTARGYVFDMERLTLVEGPFAVAHGRGSSRVRDGVPTAFSNRSGSYMSSLGLYLAQETYKFSGTSGGRRYTSVGLRMRGESGVFNDAARARGIVAHGAPYVTRTAAGRSEGCPAMEPDRAQRLLPMLADGGVVFIYSPHDERWLRGDPWINAE